MHCLCRKGAQVTQSRRQFAVHPVMHDAAVDSAGTLRQALVRDPWATQEAPTIARNRSGGTAVDGYRQPRRERQASSCLKRDYQTAPGGRARPRQPCRAHSGVAPLGSAECPRKVRGESPHRNSIHRRVARLALAGSATPVRWCPEMRRRPQSSSSEAATHSLRYPGLPNFGPSAFPVQRECTGG